MSERRNISFSSNWDPDETGHELAAPVSERLHAVYGPGYVYRLGDEDDPSYDLEVFPDTNTVRLKSRDVFIALRNARTPTPVNGAVLFDYQEENRSGYLMVSGDGEINLFVHHSRELALTTTSGDFLRRQNPPPQNEEFAAFSQSERDQPRVKLQGRLEDEPRFQESRQGGLIARFNLAVHEDEGTTWYEIYSTRHYAERIRDSEFHGGEVITVFGLRQQQPIPNPEGELKTKEVIYAFGVRRVEGATQG
jgi:hypothetical protein